MNNDYKSSNILNNENAVKNKANKIPQMYGNCILEMGDGQSLHIYVNYIESQMLMSAIDNNKAELIVSIVEHWD